MLEISNKPCLESLKIQPNSVLLHFLQTQCGLNMPVSHTDVFFAQFHVINQESRLTIAPK